MGEGCGCKDCKRVREHVASLLPFRVLEAAVGKPLRISGVALSAGLSRNFNVYTVEELQAFAEILVNSPMYIEHVAVPNAIGKTTKTWYDSVSRCLMYEAEVYDQAIADKIRNGLIQHVSVGADYDTIDSVGAKVPHGLHNAELSLVAVPGIPEANIQVLERLRESLAGKGQVKFKEKVKEQDDVFCVFCSNPADFFVSICQSCVDKFSLPAAGPASQASQSGVEKLEEKDLNALAEKVAAKVGEKDSAVVEKLKKDLAEASGKLSDAEGKLGVAESAKADALSKLGAANKTVENLRKLLPGEGLLVNPPKMIPVSEAVAILEAVLPSTLVERSAGLGMQRLCQGIRSDVLKLKERAGAK